MKNSVRKQRPLYNESQAAEGRASIGEAESKFTTKKLSALPHKKKILAKNCHCFSHLILLLSKRKIGFRVYLCLNGFNYSYENSSL